MFVHDYYFNYFQVGAQSLGEDFFRGDVLAFGPAFQTAWEPLARAALRGGVWLKGGYATESIRTGDSIVSVASSASILYYSDVVTYPDNTSEEITIVSRPCPVFENGEKLVMQRGSRFLHRTLHPGAGAGRRDLPQVADRTGTQRGVRDPNGLHAGDPGRL